MVDQVATAHDSDVETLHRLGYAQELRRRMSGFSNFAVSFTIISILSGCLTAYGVAMNNGGPVVITIGWPFVGIMVTLVGLAMAEVCSSYPTAGGLYYWAAKLGGKNSAGWSWFTGWFNLLGQVGVTAGIDGAWPCSRRHFSTTGSTIPRRTAHSSGLRGRTLPARPAEHIRGAVGRNPQQHLGVVAHHRCRRHRGGAVREGASASVGRLHLWPLHQQHGGIVRRLDHLCAVDRHAACAVHLHRLRRLGAHDRGDPQCGGRRPAWHRDVDRGLAGCRMDPADRRHRRDPGLRG